MKDRLISSIQDPRLLEHLYQEDPDGFIAAFQEVFPDHPDSLVLQCWQERLSYTPGAKEKNNKNKEKSWFFYVIVFLFVIIGGLLSKLMQFMYGKYSTYEEVYLFRNISAFFLPFIAFIYLIHNKTTSKLKWIPIASILIVVVYINCLPNLVFEGKLSLYSDSFLLACFHTPLLYWFAGGFAFLGVSYKNAQRRLDWIKMNGEILFMTALILLAGIVLTGITMASFNIIGLDAEWYMEWIVIIGVIGSPIVATALLLKTIKITSLPPLLARIFSPLFLFTTLVFLVLIILRIKSPFQDRDFLMFINILVFIVMSVVTFVLIDRKPINTINILDMVVYGLLLTSFIIDIIAIVSVFFRLSQEGITPNRIALIGINIILLVNMTGILFYFSKWLFQRSGYQKVTKWIAQFLPVYLFWSAFMVFIYPWIFRLR